VDNISKEQIKQITELFDDIKFDVTTLDEALVTFGGRAYPKFGNIVILAGGAGSGKGFVLSNMIGVEGKTFDVDALKTLAINSKRLAKKVKDEMGVDLKKLNLKDPANVSELHLIVDGLGLPKNQQTTLLRSVMTAHPDRKPNLIFDVTLKNLDKLVNVAKQVQAVGYEKRNIHIVWVVNKIEIAIHQNANRDRMVDQDILINTHEGASQTIKDIINMENRLKSHMDGDIWFVFNQARVDSELVKSGKGGQFVKKIDKIQIKKQGKKPLNSSQLSDRVVSKIREYVPNPEIWGESVIDSDTKMIEEAAVNDRVTFGKVDSPQKVKAVGWVSNRVSGKLVSRYIVKLDTFEKKMFGSKGVYRWVSDIDDNRTGIVKINVKTGTMAFLDNDEDQATFDRSFKFTKMVISDKTAF
jgi:hypothetical protein